MKERKIEVYNHDQMVGILAETADHRVASAYSHMAKVRIRHQPILASGGAESISPHLNRISRPVGCT